jgi:hypothetical protein
LFGILTACSSSPSVPIDIEETSNTEEPAWMNDDSIEKVTIMGKLYPVFPVDNTVLIDEEEERKKIIEVKDLWIEKSPSGKMSYDKVCIKYQNKLQDFSIDSVTIYAYYLDKEGERIGKCAYFGDYMPLEPNEIRVERALFALSTLKPEDIKDEWSGEIECEIKYLYVKVE